MDSEFTVWTEPFPEAFNYDTKTRMLIVTWTDGKKIRYFDLDPRLAFLDSSNSHRASDFIKYVREHPKLKQENIRSDVNPAPPKPQAAPLESGTPQTRPALVYQQQTRSGEPETKLRFIDTVPFVAKVGKE